MNIGAVLAQPISAGKHAGLIGVGIAAGLGVGALVHQAQGPNPPELLGMPVAKLVAFAGITAAWFGMALVKADTKGAALLAATVAGAAATMLPLSAEPT